MRRLITHPPQDTIFCSYCWVQAIATPALLIYFVSQQQFTMSHEKTNKPRTSFPKTCLTELACPRTGRLFLKPYSCPFCHTDQTQWLRKLKLHQKWEFKWVCVLVWCCCKDKGTEKFRAYLIISPLGAQGKEPFYSMHPTVTAKWFQLRGGL